MQASLPVSLVRERAGRRNARVLALCQALYTSSVSIDLTLTGLVGYTLADDKALATLPFSLITVAAALTTIFASFLMARIGRRAGFALGQPWVPRAGRFRYTRSSRTAFGSSAAGRLPSACSRRSRSTTAWLPPMPSILN